MPRRSSSIYPYTTLFRSAFVEFAGDGCGAELCRQDVARILKGKTHFCEPAGTAGLRAVKDKALQIFASKVARSEEHTSELQSQFHIVCRLMLEQYDRVRE